MSKNYYIHKLKAQCNLNSLIYMIISDITAKYLKIEEVNQLCGNMLRLML